MLLVAGCGTDEREADSDTQQTPSTPAEPDSAWEGIEGQRVTPSASCLVAMQAAADEPDSDRADTLIRTSLDECSGVDEWLSALDEHPGALGLTEHAVIGALDLRAACFPSPDSTVCQDANARGVTP